jgi:sulfatase maturation enzyme AslB (radical SAM superfamily)
MNKIGCYRPWVSIHVDESSQGMKPCCWVKQNLSVLQSDSTLENTFFNENWEKMRVDMYNANGNLPTQCPMYCQTRLDDEYYDNLFHERITSYIENSIKWDQAPFEFASTIANACNLKCKTCWIFDNFDYVINIEGLNRVIADILDKSKDNVKNGWPMFDINMTGGEIFYAKPMRETLYKYIQDPEAGKTFNISFITNGTIWDQKFWDILETKPNSISHITMSIDGYDKDSYENIRGVDKFDTVHQNLDKMIEWRNSHIETHGKWSIYINTLINSVTYPKLKLIVDIFREKDVYVNFIPLVVDYKPNHPFQCYNKKEHQQLCLDSIRDAKNYVVEMVRSLSDDSENKWQLNSMIISLQRNETYVMNLMLQK